MSNSRISGIIDSLPTLTKDDVDIGDHCPICFVDFKTILDNDDSEESEGGSAAAGSGLTRIVGCRHVFCRKDLVQWIQTRHGSCPTCRHIFLPRSESDEESEDGDYFPDDSVDDYEDEDEEFDDDDDDLDDAEEVEFSDNPSDEDHISDEEAIVFEDDMSHGYSDILTSEQLRWLAGSPTEFGGSSDVSVPDWAEYLEDVRLCFDSEFYGNMREY